MVLGAAIGGAIANVPTWEAGYATNSVGGVLAAMLLPIGRFGKFVVVVLSFSLLGNNAATMYSITLNLQLLVPQLLRVPRYVFSIVITAILRVHKNQRVQIFFLEAVEGGRNRPRRGASQKCCCLRH